MCVKSLIVFSLCRSTLIINKEIPKVTYYYVLILNLNLKCISDIDIKRIIYLTSPGKTGRVV